MADTAYSVDVELGLKDVAKAKRQANGVVRAIRHIEAAHHKEMAAASKSANLAARLGRQRILGSKRRQVALERQHRHAARLIRKQRRLMEQLAASASKAAVSTGSVFSSIGRGIRGSLAPSGHLVRNLVAMGATYMALRLVSRAIESIASGAMEANSSVEGTILSIASLYTEVESVSFDEATRSAERLHDTLQELAIESPGTTGELADMFTMAYGPMRRAGVEMNRLTTFSRDAVAVASALRIDAPQVARDISMMASGVAGQDVRTFRMLRSMGMITESTEDWNRIALATPAETAERLISIFDRLGRQSAEAFGRTWAGVTSATEDIANYFVRAATSPAFAIIRDQLRAVNTLLIKFRPAISKLLTVFGGGIARVFTRAINGMRENFTWLVTHLDLVALRIDQVFAAVRRFAPIIRTMLIAGVALRVAGIALGAAFSAAGAIVGTLGSIAGVLIPLLGGGGLAALGGGAVAAGGAATAATGGLAPLLLVLAPLIFLLGTLPILLAGFIQMAVTVGAVFTALARNGKELGRYFYEGGEILLAAVLSVWDGFQAVWITVSPALEALGFILVSVVGIAFRWVAKLIYAASRAFRFIAGVMMVIAHTLEPKFNRLVIQTQLLLAVFEQFTNRLIALLPSLRISTPRVTGTTTPEDARDWLKEMRQGFGAAMRGTPQAPGENGTGTAPGDRPERPAADFRGSRITVNQEFRDADPDRVWVQMREGLEREATSRISSGFTPALTG